MIDILNRKLNEGSIVVVKPTSRYSYGLKLGVILNEKGSVLICAPEEKKTDNNRPVSGYSEYFLIENPSEYEKELVSKALKEFNISIVKKPLKMSELKHLYSYANKINQEFIYLKNISFDLISKNNNFVCNMEFNNYFIEKVCWDESLITSQKKGMIKIYDEIKCFTEEEVINKLKERSLYIHRDFKISSGKVFYIKEFLDKHPSECHVTDQQAYRNSFYRKPTYITVRVDNVKIIS